MDMFIEDLIKELAEQAKMVNASKYSIKFEAPDGGVLTMTYTMPNNNQ